MIAQKYFLVLALTCLITIFSSCGHSGDSSQASAPSQAIPVTYQTQMMRGNTTWVASRNDLPAGATISATVTNTLSEAHGFQIAGLVSPVVVQPNETKSVTFVVPAQAGGLAVSCHLHGSFVVPSNITVSQ
jgi:hypothetical protein